MKRKVCMALCGTMMMSMLVGCGSDNASVEANGSSNEKAGNAEEETITIWHDGDESIMNVIADTVNDELKDENVQVVFEKKSGLTDQMQLYGNDEQNGPDMYLYAHDSLGTFAEMGILAPITDFISEQDEADLLDMTVKAGTYAGEQYMLPLYYETLLFLYNKDLWEGEIPDTTEDLYDYMKEHTDKKAGTYAVVNQHSTAYNVAPVINGYDAYIIDQDANAGLNTKEMKEALAYNKKFAELEGEGDYDTCNTLFNEQKAAAIIGGPWLISGIKDAGINYGIRSLADFKLPNKKGLAPYSGIQGVGVLKYAQENKKDAITDVLKALSSKELGVELAEKSSCAPANEKAYEEDAVKQNEMIMAMRETAETAQPMPNIPQMSVMWGPTESLLAAVNKSNEKIDEAADTYQEQAETAIKDMQ